MLDPDTILISIPLLLRLFRMQPAHTTPHPKYWLRALTPSWRFFETSGHHPTLYHRIYHQDHEPGPWQLSLPRSERKWLSLFLNPQGNYLLACNTLLHQLLIDLEHIGPNASETLSHNVSYKLVKNLVRQQIQSQPSNKPPDRYQFKIVLLDSLQKSSEDFLISPVYEASLAD